MLVSVVKRDGREVTFEKENIFRAIAKAYTEVYGNADDDAFLDSVTNRVVDSVTYKPSVTVEEIQDQVEKVLATMDFNVARAYIIYRDKRKNAREGNGKPNLTQRIVDAKGHLDYVDGKAIFDEASPLLNSQSTAKDINNILLFTGRSFIERAPEYSYFAARVLLSDLYQEVTEGRVTFLSDMTDQIYRETFITCLETGIENKRIDPALLGSFFNLNDIARALRPERDYMFKYLGLQTLHDRYFIHISGRRIEMPQTFWMRVAMGLALAEKENHTAYAIQFYEHLSMFRVCSSTPTLFNAGTLNPQLSSCYLQTVDDDLGSIFKVYSDSAQLSKWAGGLGVDFTPIRSLGSHIAGVNGKSSGTIPFIKIMNDTVAGVSQAGKRRGSAAVYMEVWHGDIEEFIDLRKNTGDERRRAHDLNTAVWIPDLFMKRVQEKGTWTLISPSDSPYLHELYGPAFNIAYEAAERKVLEGKIPGKVVAALTLWRKILTSLFETGHPWVTFKDPSNIRNNQKHVGTVHSSNLCTEILLNTSTNDEEIAVCNLASVNLPTHMVNGELNQARLEETVTVAIRMLDNVIDINFYPVPEARNSNMRHRPVGLGIMGFQDCLWDMNISYASPDAVQFANDSMEAISFYAIQSSMELAMERGEYESFPGSEWSHGHLPMDTIFSLMQARDSLDTDINIDTKFPWNNLRVMVQSFGMRNSNVMAIAPTATISNIQGVTQSIEPMFSNLFVKSNLSGDFTMVNDRLVYDLREIGLWNDAILESIKYWDGSIAHIEEIPLEIRLKYPTAFEIEPEWLIDAAAHRQIWIDMGQSLNLYVNTPNGKKLNDMYMLAWTKGLKTTYYLRSKGATTIEKSTVDVNARGIQPSWMKNKSEASNVQVIRDGITTEVPGFKSLIVDDFEDMMCEACQ